MEENGGMIIPDQDLVNHIVVLTGTIIEGKFFRYLIRQVQLIVDDRFHCYAGEA